MMVAVAVVVHVIGSMVLGTVVAAVPMMNVVAAGEGDVVHLFDDMMVAVVVPLLLLLFRPFRIFQVTCVAVVMVRLSFPKSMDGDGGGDAADIPHHSSLHPLRVVAVAKEAHDDGGDSGVVAVAVVDVMHTDGIGYMEEVVVVAHPYNMATVVVVVVAVLHADAPCYLSARCRHPCREDVYLYCCSDDRHDHHGNVVVVDCTCHDSAVEVKTMTMEAEVVVDPRLLGSGEESSGGGGAAICASMTEAVVVDPRHRLSLHCI